MAFRTQKISQMTPKGANLEGTDLLEVSTIESGSYVTRSITGQEIIDAAAAAGGVTSVGATAPIASSGGTTPTISIATADTSTTGALTSTDWNTFNGKQDALTLTTTGTSGAATLVGSTLNIPQYSGGASANPSVITARYVDGTIVTGTTANAISMSLLIPANTFTGNGMLEVLCRATRTSGTLTYRIYKNTTNSLTGATQIATLNSSTSGFIQAIRTFRINTNVISYLNVGVNNTIDYASNANIPSTTSFVTSVDQYIILAIQPGTTTDSAFFDMARAVKYI